MKTTVHFGSNEGPHKGTILRNFNKNFFRIDPETKVFDFLKVGELLAACARNNYAAMKIHPKTELSKVQLLRLRAVFHTVPIFHSLT